MTIDAIRFKSREDWLAARKDSVGASEVPALFGISPYMSAFELFAEKSGAYTRQFQTAEILENSIHLPPNERGTALEPVAFELTERLKPTWTVTPNMIPGGLFYVDRDARMSCTPDAFVRDPSRDGIGALQIKSMEIHVFSRTWAVVDGGEIVPPVSVAAQAIVDATLSGCQWAYVGAIVVGYGVDFYLVEVPLKSALMVRARELVAEFWDRIARNENYPPDYGRDAAAISQIYRDDDGSESDQTANERLAELADLRTGLKLQEAAGEAAKKARKPIDAEILVALGNAARARIAGGRVISAKTVRKEAHMVKATAYRQIRVLG